jgi:glycine dehydrogenase
MAAMYAVYHGPIGLRRIAGKVHGLTRVLKNFVESSSFEVVNKRFFDTLTIDVSPTGLSVADLHAKAESLGVNLRHVDDKHVGITLDESVGAAEFRTILEIFAWQPLDLTKTQIFDFDPATSTALPSTLQRTSEILPHPVFNKHHSETEMLRYINQLAQKDLSLVHAMIPLGSCTMKLNSTTSMIPLTWPEFGSVHPFAPQDQVKGYEQIIKVPP